MHNHVHRTINYNLGLTSKGRTGNLLTSALKNGQTHNNLVHLFYAHDVEHSDQFIVVNNCFIFALNYRLNFN